MNTRFERLSENDYWGEDEFYNIIEDAMLIQLEDIKNVTYQGEKRIPKNRLYNTRDGFNAIKKEHLYIPNGDRYFQNPDNFNKSKLHLIDGERIPRIATIYNIFNKSVTAYIKQSGKPKQLRTVGNGDIYEVAAFALQDNNIDSGKGHIAISKNGTVSRCSIVTEVWGGGFGRPNLSIDQDAIEKDVTEKWFLSGFFGLQLYIDKRHCWTIKAEEGNCKIELGCNSEQIKSLLYARHAPLTETGRLSPILHLVASHNRRIKKGVDVKNVEIQNYLRGQQTVDIGSTRFTVCPPEALGEKLTENSLRYFD